MESGNGYTTGEQAACLPGFNQFPGIMYNFVTRTVLLLLLAIVAGTTFAEAQVPGQQPQQQAAIEPVQPDEISDEDLIAFIEASDAVRPIQMQAREEIEEVIHSYGMNVDRFAEIARVINTPNEAQADITSAEHQMMAQMEEELSDIEVKTRQKIVIVMAEKGLEVEDYHRIYLSIQQYPELRERIEPLVE